MVRLRCKTCLEWRGRHGSDAGTAQLLSGEGAKPARNSEAANPSAGECGAKDQVSQAGALWPFPDRRSVFLRARFDAPFPMVEDRRKGRDRSPVGKEARVDLVMTGR